MFKKILIANRGEIACRVAATARRLGIRTVAVYADIDAHAKHVLACDEAVRIGGDAPGESYLCGERVIEAARASGADAIHPGYGFLSENAGFAQACADAGIVFIGPPPAAIHAMGLKSESKRLMEAAGVPLVPGYHGVDQDPALLRREADRIGYPVLIKASAGGGGKGMRVVESADAFDAALASCRREASSSFGNDAVLIERYVTRPRHVEIQVFGDTHGNLVHLFERDCSVQRRHQKVLEEAPAPGLGEARRREMGAAAIAAARAVGYVGAGTVEFIAEPTESGDLRFWFMEMNTRLQVEHPVTEAITGLDLVEWQLRVAAGEALPLTQDELRIRGHSIEARICAENPDANFMPSTGRLDVFRVPDATEFDRAPVRIDAGVREGDTISPFYDPMIAKLIVWGADRAEALARLDQALAATHLVGPHTNVAFLRRVIATRSFAGADLDTALIERERAALFEAPPLAVELVAGAVVADAIAAERALEGADPWSRRDGWRLHGSALRRFDIEIDGTHHVARLERSRDGAPTLALGERRWPIEVAARGAGRHDVTLGEARHAVTVLGAGEQLAVFAADGTARLRLVDPIAHARDAATPEGGLSAPMPGKVVAFLAGVGDRVEAGQPLAVMEAMKMEHTITAPHAGRVKELLYAVGDQVAEGGELLSLEPA
ncbi:acetyl-CoA carboxylase biotin carboxylase subunit [Piscinibacter koreensis]|uniref:Acetyl/propionyl/methylcrotonyl-CoA carboxylase subunit alpha n=1 Tax=Piscinibacter koreensis TaxID=2742824 RepID=A0A7Y6NKC2_9BURK|nr:acetyl/propionyl/methylcrotonyl-CoA carboxylase subunit alpha [Schlegelella koreensis]NUZ04793.1 acetyl/propionyl/methylcrotonyl-CoA carboxylase subunit alpha [Schlegelella koreensis]